MGRIRLNVTLAAALFVAAFGSPAAAQQDVPLDTASVDIRAYLDSALTIMRAHAISGDTIDWAAFRDSVYAWAAPAEEMADAHWALMVAARRINPHSFLRIPPPAMLQMARRRQALAAPSAASGTRSAASRMSSAAPGENAPSAPTQPRVRSPFSQRNIPDGSLHARDGRLFGQISIPSFSASHRTAFADSIEDLVREYDAAGACGWIVDLRGNGGGNMWPMLAGIGPLLAGDTIGWFHGAGSELRGWYYRNGYAGTFDDGVRTSAAWVSGEPHRIEGTPPVAVLFDAGTMSSGEATAIAFIGRPNTRTFGVPSSGFTTANSTFALPDRATLVLTTGLEADRTGTVHYGALVPDEVVPIVPEGEAIPSTPPDPDPQLDAALEWLRARPGCAETGRAAG